VVQNSDPWYARQELGYFEVVGAVFGLSLLPSDEVGIAFANEKIMSTIPPDDRCRKFADYIVDHYTLTPGVILHLTYGLQVLNRVRQQPMQLSYSMQTIRAASLTSSATYARWISLCALVFLLSVCYVLLFCA